MKNQKLKTDIHVFWYLYVAVFRTVVGSFPVPASSMVPFNLKLSMIVQALLYRIKPVT